MATAVFKEELATVQNVTINMEKRSSSDYPELECHKTTQGYTVVTGKTQEVMFTIGAMADNGFNSLEKFTL